MAPDRALALEPGRGLGPFELGALLWDVLTTLRSSQNEYSAVQVAWNAAEAATGPILLSLTTPPVRLAFDGRTQRLVLIEAVSPPAPSPKRGQSASTRLLTVADFVAYKGQPLSAVSNELERRVTAKMLHRIFGPTYPAAPHRTYIDENTLSYPGVAFSISDTAGLARVIVTPPLSETDATPVGEAYLFRPSVPVSDAMDGDVREAVIGLDAERPSRVTFRFHSKAREQKIQDVTVVIGQTTAEDINVEFGAPLRTFWKEDDRMRIHAHLNSAGPSEQVQPPNPYFLSYFNLGIDFLVDPIRHHVLKVILHSNIPGEVLFGRYSRCPWTLAGHSIGTKAQTMTAKVQALLSTPSHLAPSLAPPTTSSPSPSPPPLVGKSKPSKNSRDWSPAALPALPAPPQTTGQRALASTPLEPAMELDRTADLADEGLTLQKPTSLVGFKGLVMEVTSTDEVETLWIF